MNAACSAAACSSSRPRGCSRSLRPARARTVARSPRPTAAPAASPSVSAATRGVPAKIQMTRGARVIWKNPTSVDHNVVAYGGKWSFRQYLPQGQSVSYVFSNAGTYLFRDSLHSYAVRRRLLRHVRPGRRAELIQDPSSSRERGRIDRRIGVDRDRPAHDAEIPVGPGREAAMRARPVVLLVAVFGILAACTQSGSTPPRS